MKTTNPFFYSDDNKRYHTWNYYLKHKFTSKVFKVPLNAYFTCPNRDGTCGYGGCTFCGSSGSSAFPENIKDDLFSQFEKGKEIMLRKWPNGLAMAYFQSYTNTYAPLPVLKKHFEPFMDREDVMGICIATRADCLSDETISYLNTLSQRKEIWVELGLQSIHDKTAQLTNRGHTFKTFEDTIHKLSRTNLKICVHLMNSLPYETKEMMIESAKTIAHLPIHAVKIHMLHILKNTKMYEQYKNSPFSLLSMEEYIDIVISQLECFPPELIIQRLTGDALKNELITPEWTLKKINVLNGIDKEMARRETYQGKNYVK